MTLSFPEFWKIKEDPFLAQDWRQEKDGSPSLKGSARGLTAYGPRGSEGLSTCRCVPTSGSTLGLHYPEA